MSGLRFPKIPAKPGTLDTLLRDWFGYRAVVQNGEWFVPPTDRALRAGPRDALKIHPRRILNQTKLKSVASKMLEAIPSDFDEHLPELRKTLPEKVKVPGGLGFASELHAYLAEVSVAGEEQVEEALVDRLLPLLMDKFGVQYIVPVTVAAERVQQYSSFGKVTLLAQRNPWPRVNELLKDKKAFLGIQLNSLDVLDFVDALTRCAPVAFTLPVRRYGCTWHFLGPGLFTFPSLLVRSVFQDFLTTVSSPRSDDWWMPGLRGLKGMNDRNIWRLLRQIVFGVNDLMAHLNNPLTFTDATGAPDFLKQMKAHGAVVLLFADLAGLNIEIGSHNRITYTFGFLDKLANLRLGMGGGRYANEPEVMRNLASLSQGKDLKRVIKKKIGGLHPELVDPLAFVYLTNAINALHKAYQGDTPCQMKHRLSRKFIKSRRSPGIIPNEPSFSGFKQIRRLVNWFCGYQEPPGGN